MASLPSLGDEPQGLGESKSFLGRRLRFRLQTRIFSKYKEKNFHRCLPPEALWQERQGGTSLLTKLQDSSFGYLAYQGPPKGIV